MSNFIGESNFYFGVVEDRMDPKMLGRARVRIFGLHSYDKSLLPTEDLPWAYKIQPSTSGAISGIGHAPVGVMEGTWVAIQFIDPDKQMPLIIGSLGGVPQSSNPDLERFILETSQVSTPIQVDNNIVRSEDGTPITDSSGNPIRTEEPPQTATNRFANQNWRELVITRLGFLESSNNYRAVNQFNFIGKYQFGAAALTDRGYVVRGSRNLDLNSPSAWIGKNGIRSKEDFLSNHAAQERIMREHVSANIRTMQRIGMPINEMSDADKAGWVAVAHLLGAGGARQLYNGVDRADGNGVRGSHYFREGFMSVSGEVPTSIPNRTNVARPNTVSARNEAAIQQSTQINQQEPVNAAVDSMGARTAIRRKINGGGFQDPNGKYPLIDHLNESDTNRLARHEKIGKTVVFSKERARHLEVNKANGRGKWDQAAVPYNAKYPFNNVWQSESGHLLEFDDTEENERVHLYHAAGTFTEIDHNGSQVRFVIGDDYTIVERNGYVHITGAQHVKIDGAKTLLVEGRADIQINGPSTINIHNSANVNVASDFNLTVGGNFNINTVGNISMFAGGNTGIDTGGVILLNSGAATWASGMPTIGVIPESGINVSPLKVNTRGEGVAIQHEVNPEAPEEYEFFANLAVGEGILTEEELNSDPVVQETTPTDRPTNKLEGKAVEKVPDTKTDFDLDDRISRFYRLRDVTRGQQIRPNVGLTETQIFNNLRSLAINVLDPIRERWPNVRINSGLRFAQNTSQHNRGQAVDISFPDVSRAALFNRIQEVEQMVPYDQMILEYLTPGGNGWIHISFRENGNRKQRFTMNNHKRVGTMGTFSRVA